MVTVSEVKWYQTKDGKCPMCGRNRSLGRLNIGWYDEEDEIIGDRCIDCCFGPPEEFWHYCPKCKERYAGYACDSGGWNKEKNKPVCKGKKLGALTR